MRSRRRNTGRGQSLVEFALVIPIFIVILFGLIDIGRLVYTNSVLSQGVREGARLGAVEARRIHLGVSTDPQYDLSCGKTGGPVCPVDVNALVTDITAATNRMVAGIGGTITTVYVSCDQPVDVPSGAWTGTSCAHNGQGNVLSVRVLYSYTPITPIAGWLIGPITLSASSTMVID